ncbi:MAG: site-specific DNA-methyltransferase [Treponema sp.]|nr:site-specific DNA-methyltransferase [Treponema sp.]
MDKLNMKTANIADENFKKLSAMFPNAVTETITGYDEEGNAIIEHCIDKDILMQEINCKVVDGKEERYQFTWPDKRKAILAANSPISETLRPCKEESVGKDGTPGAFDSENLYIEGDNLDVLKLLQETYLGKIKMIYIDPPYNTGNDFVYEDDFSETTDEYLEKSGQFDKDGNRLVQNTESNGRFHTDWLNMIYPRLKLARNLLTDDGVILINMDENEITNLQKICNEVFGEKNDLGTIIWDKRNPKGDSRGISYQHENILVYAKDYFTFTTKCKLQRPKKNAKAMLDKAAQLFSKISPNYTLENCNSDFNEWIKSKKTELSGGEAAYNKIDEEGNVYRPVSMAWPNKKKAPDEYFIPLIHPITKKPCPLPERGWRNPPKTMEELLSKNLILFGKDETTQPNRKYLLKENMYENIPSMIYYGGSDTDMLSEMKIPFDTPKVVDICIEHIKALTNSDSIILDFFAGSSTTAHAVLKLNEIDEGKRKFIMVQVPQKINEDDEAYKAGFKNLCEIGKERIRRAGAKIREENALTAGDLDTGFRVLKLDSTNMKDVYYNPEEVTQSTLDGFIDNIKGDRTNEDLLFQTMLELGVPLSSKITTEKINGVTVYNVGEENFLIATYDSGVTDEIVTKIAKKQPYYFVVRDSSMDNDAVAANFEQIFKTYSPDTKRKVL